MITRVNYVKLWSDLSADKSMILMTGPRQSGKTTLSKQIKDTVTNNIYFNWDIQSNKRKIIEDPTFFQEINRVDESVPLVIFDEIHKYKDWKNYLKGIYDEFHDEYLFLITGSGRLDVFRKGGDSLAGRYLMFHLFPFTISEFGKNKRNILADNFNWIDGFNINPDSDTSELWNNLYNFSGFPEPFTKANKHFYNKWSNTYSHQIIHEEIRNFADIRNINTTELLYSLLPSKTGSPLSINSIARDIQVAHETVKNWLQLFETVFLVFKIEPWTKNISRSILKEKKYYLFNYCSISNEAARFENMVALELFRLVYYWNEQGLGNYSLNYIRNKEKSEVDFLITKDSEPALLIEAKLSSNVPAKNLLYFQDILKIPAVQLVNKENVYKKIKNGKNYVLITTAHNWLSSL